MAKQKGRRRLKVKTTEVDGFSIREIRPGYWRVDCMIDGRRIRPCFTEYAKAVTFCRMKRSEVTRKGTQSLDFPDHMRRDAQAALARIEGTGKTLLEIAEDYLCRYPVVVGETVRQVADNYIVCMSNEGCREASLRDKRWKLNALCKALGDRAATSVSNADLRAWAVEQGWTGRTALAYVKAGETLLRFARGEKRTKHRRADEAPPPTWSVETVQKLLRTAETKTPAVVPALAVLFFAGLRPTELLRLTWEHIDLGARLIKLGGDITKTRTMRNVQIRDNLAAWLDRYKGSGAVVESAARYRTMRVKAMRECSIAKWPTDVPRHTFATMLYAVTDDAAKVAAQLGHFGSVDTFARHYKGCPATAADGKAFFEILPIPLKAAPSKSA